MLYNIVLLLGYNIQLAVTNTKPASLSQYLSNVIVISMVAYLFCFLMGIIRVIKNDSSVIIAALFNHSLVDVFVDSVGLYFKYNTLPFIITLAGGVSVLYIMQGVI